jgi:outer membrane protein
LLKRTSAFIALVVLTFAFIVATPMPSIAKQKGDLLIRLRGAYVNPDVDGTTSVGGSADADSDLVPELDFTYFITDNIAVELILATTTHDVKVNGVPDLGAVSLIPPILTLQYHFNPKGKLSPYVGAGVNYTIFYDENPSSDISNIDYDNAFGWALQAGVDFAFDSRWSINFDVKKVWLNTDVSVNSGAITANDVDIDPWIISLGIGYRFSL